MEKSDGKSDTHSSVGPKMSVSCIEERYGPWALAADRSAASIFSPLIASIYRMGILRKACLSLVRRIEGGVMHSTTLRRLLKECHGVTVGRYSYGACFVPGALPPGSSIGNYCSMADGLQIFRRNHPSVTLSQHPFFYNKELGLLSEDTIIRIEDNPLRIGHDVWIGSNVTILPGSKTIGNGAIIGAGAVVTRDIPPFEIHAGNPARLIGERFSPEIRALVEQTHWWELSLFELAIAGDLLFTPATPASLKEFLSRLEDRGAATH